MGEYADDAISRMMDMDERFFDRRSMLFNDPWDELPPTIRTTCQRCQAKVELRGKGKGDYKVYERGSPHEHTCNTVADADEFPEVESWE